MVSGFVERYVVEILVRLFPRALGAYIALFTTLLYPSTTKGIARRNVRWKLVGLKV